MASFRPLSFLCLLLTLISLPTAVPSNIFLNSYCDTSEQNYTTHSTYNSNLNIILAKLPSNTLIDYGFYNLSYGKSPNQVYATGLCRGDVKPNNCRKCLKDAGKILRKQCPNQKKATGYDNKCTLRYSPSPIFGILALDFSSYYMCNQNDTTKVEQFDQVLSGLIKNLTSIAASGDSHRKYAEASTTGPTSETIYANAQCSPDLSKEQCTEYLEEAFPGSFAFCEGKRGGRFLGPSCNLRYEFYRFYGPKAEEPPQAAPLKLKMLPYVRDGLRGPIPCLVGCSIGAECACSKDSN